MKALASTNPIAAVELQLGRNPHSKRPNLKEIMVGERGIFGKSDPKKELNFYEFYFKDFVKVIVICFDSGLNGTLAFCVNLQML